MKLSEPIIKQTFKIIVLRRKSDPLPDSFTLSEMDYLISYDTMIGDVEQASVEEITDPERVRTELLAIGNDGFFFDDSEFMEEDEEESE